MSRARFTLVGLAASAAEGEDGAAFEACDGVAPFAELPAWPLDELLEPVPEPVLEEVLEKDVCGV